MQVDLDHARIRGDGHAIEPWIERRRRALDDHRQLQRRRGVLDRADEIEVVLRGADRRHEYVEPALARLHTERRADDATRSVAPLRWHLVSRAPGDAIDSAGRKTD